MRHHPVSVIALPQPSPGQGFTFRPSGAVVTELVAVSFRVVTSAGVANRQATVEFRDSAGFSFATVAAPFVQTATHTVDYSFVCGGMQYGANDAAQIGGPLPCLSLDNTFEVRVGLAAVQAADQLSRVTLAARLWPVDADE